MCIFIGCRQSVSDGCKTMGRTIPGFDGSSFALVTRRGKSRQAQPEDARALDVPPGRRRGLNESGQKRLWIVSTLLSPSRRYSMPSMLFFTM